MSDDKTTAVATAGAGGAIATVGGVTAAPGALATAGAGAAIASVGGVTAAPVAVTDAQGTTKVRSKGIETLQWITMTNGEIPKFAVSAGRDNQGPVYVARAYHIGHLLPGRLVPSQGCAYIPMFAKEYSYKTYDVLTNPEDCKLKWVAAPPGDNPPAGSVNGGSQDGQIMAVGRKIVDGQTSVGKIVPKQHTLWLPWSGKELCFKDYEVLVCTDP